MLVSSRPDLFCDSGRRHSKADVLINSIACMRTLFSSVDRMRMPCARRLERCSCTFQLMMIVCGGTSVDFQVEPGATSEDRG